MYIGRWLESIPKLEELLKSTPYDPKAVLSLPSRDSPPLLRQLLAGQPPPPAATAPAHSNGKAYELAWQASSDAVATPVERLTQCGIRVMANSAFQRCTPPQCALHRCSSRRTWQRLQPIRAGERCGWRIARSAAAALGSVPNSANDYVCGSGSLQSM